MPQVNLELHSQCAGYFVISTDKRGELARFPNLITDGGLNRMGDNNDWMRYCSVGSGSAAPTFTDTGLVAQIASTQTRVAASVTGAQPSAPYFSWIRNTFRFAAGAAAGNLSEAGVGWQVTGGLFSRARILDGSGNPTTITIQADETLDVTYEFRLYPKTTDDTGQVTFSGNIGGVYDWTFRAARVVSAAADGWRFDQNGSSMGRDPTSVNQQAFYEGAIAGITGSPSGTFQGGSYLAAAYSTGSFERQFTLLADLSIANFATGVGSAWITPGPTSFQIGFTPKIPKTSSDILSIVFRHSWGRRP
jgi:hypothetical protein